MVPDPVHLLFILNVEAQGGMTTLAKKTTKGRESLYKTLSKAGAVFK